MTSLCPLLMVPVSACPAAAQDKDAPGVAEQIKLLKSDDARLRRQAAMTLMKMGPRGKAAIPCLIDTLRDKNTDARWAAVNALWKIGPAAVPDLAEALKDDNVQVGRCSAEALGAIGPPARSAVEALVRTLKDKHVAERGQAAHR